MSREFINGYSICYRLETTRGPLVTVLLHAFGRISGDCLIMLGV